MSPERCTACGAPVLAPAGATPDAPRSPPLGVRATITTCALLSGGCAMVYQLAVVSSLGFLLGETVVLFALFTGVFLFALGLGSHLAGGERVAPRTWLVATQYGLGALGCLALPLLFMLHAALFRPGLFAWMTPVLWMVGLAFDVAFGVLAGMQLPILVGLASSANGESETPQILGLDYLGSCVGALLMPLFLLPRLGLLRTVFVAALLNVASAVLASMTLGQEPRRGLPWRSLAAAGVLIVACVHASALEAVLDLLRHGF